MTGIELYSTTAANNNAAVPNGFPEGMAPSGVNDAARQMMAAIRTWYENAEFINLGHVPTYVSGTSFTVATDLTTTYQVGRRMKLVGTTPFTLYATIATSTYSSPNTTITLTMDSGTIDSSISAISVSINSVTNKSITTSMISGTLGDVTGQASSVDSEIALFSGTGGKTIKRATGTGFVKVTSGVMGTPAATIVAADIASNAVTDTKLSTLVQNAIVDDFVSGVIERPVDGDYRLLVNVPYGFTISSITTRSASGTCTATFKINTTALGGTANAVSTSEVTQAQASANVLAAGDDLVCTISSNASCTFMSFTVKFARGF